MFQQSKLQTDAEQQQAGGTIECLGMTFESDAARRAYFLEQLREKLQDPAFRHIEGFPKGSDEDILALSDPPYYTACPNPFLAEFIKLYGKPYDPSIHYNKEPLAVDVSEGRNDDIYKAHSYHTKVPPNAIIRTILHYTEPNDVILDGFAGSGMTGVAAQMCGDPAPDFKLAIERDWNAIGYTSPHWGARRVILNDLSPAATFIAANYNYPFDVSAFEQEAKRILNELKQELGWMYETSHIDGIAKGQINYTVWSDVFACPDCSGEVIFLSEAFDEKTQEVKDIFRCPHCNAELSKDRLERLYVTHLDQTLGKSIKQIKRKPVLINYSVGKSRYEKQPDDKDYALLAKIEVLPLPKTMPISEIPFMHMTHQRARMEAFGITHIHHFFLPRSAQALGVLWSKAAEITDSRLRHMLQFFIEQAVWGMSVLNRYVPSHFSQTNQQLNGVYYVASQHAEVSPWYNLGGKLERLIRAFLHSYIGTDRSIIATGTASSIGLPDCSVDYIFTDPPFGENIYYSDLNYLVESWHRVWTESRPEAIIDRAKRKGLPDYQRLMQGCFEEYSRVLKPGRWMTVVFHNSRNSVWNAIQEAMLAAGFVVADVRTLDKQRGSYRQLTSTAVKQDLIISAYKPNSGLEDRFKLTAGSENGVWDFVRTHLHQLPVFVQVQDGSGEVIAERLNHRLFDRMVAFHVQRGVSVPLSTPEFFVGLEQRFPQRDGMYFLPEQVAEYERKRLKVREIQQLQIFIANEASAIHWLRQQLTKKPQTTAELTPQFMRELTAWQKHEVQLEMVELLGENFLCYDGNGPIPAQIVAWLKKSADMRELITKEGHEVANGGMETNNAQLKARARDRWYVPDPNKVVDLENLRIKALLREFATYLEGKGRLKQFRTEAVRAGFAHAWREKDYQTVVQIAERLPEAVLQEDPDLLMYYDNASLRVHP